MPVGKEPPEKERRPFAVMAKPVGSACNMRCTYCYYLHTEGSNDKGRMSREVLERLIRDAITSSPGPVVSFTWHGGEPTLAGLPFYREAVALQKKMLPAGWECWNNLQTNGLALDKEWCAFLRQEHFDVSLSIDGDRANHDLFRKDTAQRPTYERIAASIRLLQQHGIEADLLCTVTAAASKNGKQIYRALREFQTGWMQFIPIVVRKGETSVTEESVLPEKYGTFLKEVFSEWLFHDLDRTEVQLFSEMALVLSGTPANLCWMREECGDVPVAEKDGSVYSCDHFVKPQYRIGSLQDTSLRDLVDSPAQREFGMRKKTGQPRACRECEWRMFCHGGCPKDRFLPTEGETEKQYFLCEGLKDFFAYAVPRLKEAMRLSALGRSRQQIMEELTLQERARFKGLSRNDPCPCGSGKKLKKCCLKYCP